MLALSGCASLQNLPSWVKWPRLPSAGATSAAAPAGFSQDGLPPAVQVPRGHKVGFELVGSGTLDYICTQTQSSPMPQFAWVVLGPSAQLRNRAGEAVGRYYGPPATWLHADGVRVSGYQMATAPNGADNLPLQLVKAELASGLGAFTGVTHVQRVATVGGVAPSLQCGQSNLAAKVSVPFQADYIMYRSL